MPDLDTSEVVPVERHFCKFSQFRAYLLGFLAELVNVELTAIDVQF